MKSVRCLLFLALVPGAFVTLGAGAVRGISQKPLTAGCYLQIVAPGKATQSSTMTITPQGASCCCESFETAWLDSRSFPAPCGYMNVAGRAE